MDIYIKERMKNCSIISAILALVLLFPIPMRLRDGGTVEYSALLYKVSKVHSLTTMEEMDTGKDYSEGIIVEILGVEVFNNVE